MAWVVWRILYAYLPVLSALFAFSVAMGLLRILGVELNLDLSYTLIVFTIYASFVLGFQAHSPGIRYAAWYWALVLPVSAGILWLLHQQPEWQGERWHIPLILVFGANVIGFTIGPVCLWIIRRAKARKQARLHANMPDWKKKDLPE